LPSVILLSIKISSAIKYLIFDEPCTKNFSLIFCYVSIIYFSFSTLHYYIFLDINFILIFILVLMLISNREVNY
jgi:hypothetical protein